MSYEYKDYTGTLSIKGLPYIGRTNILVMQDGKHRQVNIDNADAPTVAAELLKAAGQESVIVPKPTVQVEEFPDGDMRCGMTDASKEATAGWARSRAGELLALAEYIESKALRETEAATKLAERRNRIAVELAMGEYAADSYIPGAYASARASMQRAVDRIIELEDGEVAA